MKNKVRWNERMLVRALWLFPFPSGLPNKWIHGIEYPHRSAKASYDVQSLCLLPHPLKTRRLAFVHQLLQQLRKEQGRSEPPLHYRTGSKQQGQGIVEQRIHLLL